MSQHKRPRGPIRVLVVDDHKVVRDGLTSLLTQYSDIQVVGEAGDGQHALEVAQQVSPDVILMDINMPGMNGVEATRQLRRRLPATAVVGISVHEEQEIAALMRRAGAVDYVSKDRPLEELISAIHRTADALEQPPDNPGADGADQL